MNVNGEPTLTPGLTFVNYTRAKRARRRIIIRRRIINSDFIFVREVRVTDANTREHSETNKHSEEAKYTRFWLMIRSAVKFGI